MHLRTTMPFRTLAATVALAGTMLGPTVAAAQNAEAAAPPPAAAPGDVGTIDSIITVLYGVISGPVGAPRQWDRMMTLFHPEARLIPTGCGPSGACGAQVMTPDGYRQRADSLLRTIGFREVEIARRTVRYGTVAHAFSSYESYRFEETEPFSRGINSIQLLWDGRRWWIMNVFWDSERPGNPIPPEYESGIE